MARRRAPAEREPAAQAGEEERAAGVEADAGAGAAIAQAGRTERIGFAAIARVDAARREIELCATSEAVDSFGTIFDYAASRDAFTRWLGNVREMHARRAVGRRVGVRFDDAARKVYVRARISRGAEDTWQKVLDGTLRGASIGASNVVWERQRRAVEGGERTVEVATRYDLVELSLVDNPSNPDALGYLIVRDAEPDLALLDVVEDGVEDAPTLADPALVSTDAELAAWRENEGQGVATAAGRPATTTYASADLAPARSAPMLDEALDEAGADERRSPAVASAGQSQRPSLGWDSSSPRPCHGARHALQAPGSPPGGARAPVCEEEAAEGNASALPVPLRLLTPARGPGGEVVCSPGAPDAAPGADDERAGDLRAGGRERRPASPSGERSASPDVGASGEPGQARERWHAVARAALDGCGCPLCLCALAVLTAADAPGMDGMVADEGRAERVAGAQTAALARTLAAGLTANVERLERVDVGIRETRRAVETALGTLAGAVEAMRGRVAALEAQPLPGGPVARATGLPVEKTLAGGGREAQGSDGEALRALEGLAGRLRDPQAQIAVAAELIRLRREDGAR